MYDLFDEDRQIDQGRVTLPQFMYLKGSITREVQKVVDYYQENVTSVPNEHLLVKLLLNLNVSMKREPQNYVDTVAEVGQQTCSMLRIATAANYGRVFSPGVFYGKSVTEIIIAHDTEFNVNEALVNWRELRPIQVLRHPFTDINLARPVGKYGTEEAGIAVIAINLPMLAIQWRGWWGEERQPDPSVPARRTHHFVSMYPLTNMLYSHVDMAIFNRMLNLYMLDDVAPFKRVHPFYVYDYTDRLDEYLDKEIELLRNKPMTFDHTVSAIPAIFSPDLRRVVKLPDVVPTRQIVWALLIARIPLIRFLVQLNAFTENKRNQGYLNRIKRDLQRMRNDHTLEASMPHDLVRDIDDAIHRDIEAYL
jgi:hypothetical protein